MFNWVSSFFKPSSASNNNTTTTTSPSREEEDSTMLSTITEAKENNKIPTAKLENKLNQSNNNDENTTIKVVLIATGSYSPIHVMHVHMLEAAKQHLEENYKGKYDVIAGYLSPSHDNYVHRKLGDDWIPIEHRFEMCELALQYSSWISLSRWEGMEERFSYIDSVLNVHDKVFKHYFPHHRIQVMFVAGADLAMKSGGLGQGIHSFPVVVLGRPGWTEKLKERLESRPPNPKLFFFAPEDLQEVSSTEIRRRLKIEGELYELMAPEAADYLKNVYKKFDANVP